MQVKKIIFSILVVLSLILGVWELANAQQWSNGYGYEPSPGGKLQVCEYKTWTVPTGDPYQPYRIAGGKECRFVSGPGGAYVPYYGGYGGYGGGYYGSGFHISIGGKWGSISIGR